MGLTEEAKESEKCMTMIEYIKNTSMTASKDWDAIFSCFWRNTFKIWR